MSNRTLCAAAVAAALALAACGPVGRPPETSGPSSSVPYTAPPPSPHDGERYTSQGPVGSSWAFTEGLEVRVTGATRLDRTLGVRTRSDLTRTLVRIDFSYTNLGPTVNLSEGRQLPVRLLFGADRRAAEVEGGFEGTSDQLTALVPVEVPTGATVHGANTFAVPVGALGTLSVLVVEPFRYTEHLFTGVEDLLGPAPG